VRKVPFQLALTATTLVVASADCQVGRYDGCTLAIDCVCGVSVLILLDVNDSSRAGLALGEVVENWDVS
jgi:hypothetical protein